MTGIGIGEERVRNHSIRVEIKSVNNRFLEISCRLPAGLSRRENEVRDLVKEKISRGKLYIQVSVQNNETDGLDITVNRESARAIKKLLDDLRDAAELEGPVTLKHLLQFSEIFQSGGGSDEDEEIWVEFQRALKTALKELKAARAREGETLLEDIRKRIEVLEDDLKQIEKISRNSAATLFTQLSGRIAKLLKDQDLEPERINQEIAVLADRVDVTEECVRLRSHFDLFHDVIRNADVVGKKLNFLVQELNREVNTISSKTNLAEINHLCVNMKSEIEKIREQVQNLE